MKEIVARDQVRLGAARCWQLAVNGMSYRMFRSGITIAILALAVAFLTHMLGFGILERETQGSAQSELEASHALGQKLTRLVTPDSRATILEKLGSGPSPRLVEYATWMGTDVAGLTAYRNSARRYAEAANYLDGLPPAPRAIVLGDRKAREVLDRTETTQAAQRLVARLQSVGHRAPLGGEQEFTKFIRDERPALDGAVARISAGHIAAIATVAKAYPGRDMAELVANPTPEFGAETRQAGFSLGNAQERSDLAAFARRDRDLKAIEKGLLASETRAQIARDFGISPGDINLSSVVDYVGTDSSRADGLARAMHAGQAPKSLSGARIHELFGRYSRDRELERVSTGFTRVEGGFFGLPERSQWLILLSFLVCAVGVANAMLMSVTERFTEIATMKCLGAMDGFVMMMFVFEAVIQGVVGGAVGVVLGAILALLRALVEYGGLVGAGFGASGELGLASLLSLGVGVMLAAVAAVGPSFVAARLAPMEAMRVD